MTTFDEAMAAAEQTHQRITAERVALAERRARYETQAQIVPAPAPLLADDDSVNPGAAVGIAATIVLVAVGAAGITAMLWAFSMVTR